jgi:hypothetical protein
MVHASFGAQFAMAVVEGAGWDETGSEPSDQPRGLTRLHSSKDCCRVPGPTLARFFIAYAQGLYDGCGVDRKAAEKRISHTNAARAVDLYKVGRTAEQLGATWRATELCNMKLDA